MLINVSIKLQCCIILDITIHDHKYAMMTSYLYLSLYHVEILAVVMYTRVCTVCVCVHMCVLCVCVIEYACVCMY